METYGAALRAHWLRTNSRPPVSWLNRFFTSSQDAGTSLKLTGFISPTDPSAFIRRMELPSKKAGASASPRNAGLAPAGTFNTAGDFIASPDSRPENGNQDISGRSLGSSPGDELDLFGAIEPQITGPRAKAKARALETAKSQPAGTKARVNIAKSVGAMEKVGDLDLFAAAAVRSLDASPKPRQAQSRENASGQLGFTFGSDLPSGQSASSLGDARRDRRPDPLPSGNRPDDRGDRGIDAVGRARADQSGGSRDDGNPDAADRRGRGPGSTGPRGGDENRGSRREDAGRRSLIERQRPPLDSPDRNFRIGNATVLAEGEAVTRIRNSIQRSSPDFTISLKAITRKALSTMSKMHREVFAETLKARTPDPAAIGQKFRISAKAVQNIPDQVRSRIREHERAASLARFHEFRTLVLRLHSVPMERFFES